MSDPPNDVSRLLSYEGRGTTTGHKKKKQISLQGWPCGRLRWNLTFFRLSQVYLEIPLCWDNRTEPNWHMEFPMEFPKVYILGWWFSMGCEWIVELGQYRMIWLWYSWICWRYDWFIQKIGNLLVIICVIVSSSKSESKRDDNHHWPCSVVIFSSLAFPDGSRWRLHQKNDHFSIENYGFGDETSKSMSGTMAFLETPSMPFCGQLHAFPLQEKMGSMVPWEDVLCCVHRPAATLVSCQNMQPNLTQFDRSIHRCLVFYQCQSWCWMTGSYFFRWLAYRPASRLASRPQFGVEHGSSNYWTWVCLRMGIPLVMAILVGTKMTIHCLPIYWTNPLWLNYIDYYILLVCQGFSYTCRVSTTDAKKT
jgi:hypothetical protein